MDYELKLKDEYNLLNTLNSVNKYDYKKYYNINSTSSMGILFISTENKTINSIDDFENLHFTIYGENLNNISRYIDISDTEYTFKIKKKTLNDNIFYSNTQPATVLPTLNTNSFGNNTVEYYDNAYNVNYRYVLMDEIENKSGLCSNTNTNLYVVSNIIILYHVYSKTFLISSNCKYKIENFIIPSYCFMPVKQYTNYNAYNDLLNTFFYKRLTLLNKNIFSNNNEYYNDINNLDYDIYKDCKNQINLYINPQTYSTNSIILSNWENLEKYENINLQLDIYSNIPNNN